MINNNLNYCIYIYKIIKYNIQIFIYYLWQNLKILSYTCIIIFFFYYDYLENLLSVSLITGFSSFLVYYILFIHFYFGLIY